MAQDKIVFLEYSTSTYTNILVDVNIFAENLEETFSFTNARYQSNNNFTPIRIKQLG